jgi:hypothetical protein
MATLVVGDVKEAVMGSGGVCVGRSLESGSRFCVGAFGSSLASVAVKMFLLLI